MGLWGGGGDCSENEEEEESLSIAEASFVADGYRRIVSSLVSRDMGEGTFMLAKGKSAPSQSLKGLAGAMAFYDGSWRYGEIKKVNDKMTLAGRCFLRGNPVQWFECSRVTRKRQCADI